MRSTAVLFPSGAVSATGRVLAAQRVGDQWAVITDVTPFHPLDHTWPDQPADRGTLAGIEVADCRTGAVSPDGRLLVGDDIPVRRGDPGWTWVVVHLLECGGTLPDAGQQVVLEVDEGYRRSLSAAHTACHLAALALNEATGVLWRKEPPRRDSLGSADLDALCIERSRIEPWRSEDSYRLGKSIRKKGLDTEALLADLPGLGERATARLREWAASGAAVHIETGGDAGVAARRTWTCHLGEGTAQYPCGGTHVASLADLPRELTVQYRATGQGFVGETLVG